jgi:hypothetical protein
MPHRRCQDHADGRFIMSAHRLCWRWLQQHVGGRHPRSTATQQRCSPANGSGGGGALPCVTSRTAIVGCLWQ